MKFPQTAIAIANRKSQIENGLGAGGEAGVTRALEILKSELDVTMGLCGESDITKVGRHNLMLPAPPFTIPPPSRAPAKPRSARR